MMHEGVGGVVIYCLMEMGMEWYGMEWIHVEAANNVGIVHIAV